MTVVVGSASHSAFCCNVVPVVSSEINKNQKSLQAHGGQGSVCLNI